MTTPRTPDAPIHPLLLDRWSPRAFSGAPLSEAQLASLFEAIRWAPSCLNEQPWLVVYGTGGDADHAKILDLLVDANRVWAQRAPLLLILFARRVFARNDRPNRHHGFDAGAAWMSLALQARELGLYSHAMGGFDHERAGPALGVPAQYEAMAAIAVGAIGDPAELPEPLRAREAPSPRQPASAFIRRPSAPGA